MDDKTISVKVALHGQTEGQSLPSARAYLFDRADRLIHSELVRDQSVAFNVTANQAYRVTVGPDLLAEGEAPANLAAQLAKANALSQDFLPTGPNSAELRINPNIWFCWFPTCINVHGTVAKQFSAGGTASICNGTVQIFQVDLGCTLDSFTVIDLALFRTRLIEKLALSSAGIATEASSARLAAPGNTQLGNRAVTGGAKLAAFSSAGANASLLSLADARATLSALDGAALKQFVVANKAILFPFWCELIPDGAFCWQELTEVPIQSDGTFSAEICFWCPADFPDLYFEVVQNINGVDIEISDPQIACSTYYGYDGSQSVDIVVTDPRAIACLPTGPGGPLYVWAFGIGNEPLNLIDGLETLAGTGLLPGPTPFGGTLSLQMLFHPDLRANNIKYYRWWYIFDDELTPTVINAPVTHRFQTSFTLPFFYDSYNLGPKTIGTTSNLFEIPDPNVIWVDIVDPADRPYAYFDGTEGAPPTRSGVNTAHCGGTPGRSGLVTLILEMFDSAGNFVPCNNARGSSTLGDQPGDPQPGAFGFAFPQVGGPPNAIDFAPKPNITDHGRLIFRVRIDNNVCDAELPKVATPVNSTDTDPCGILQFNNDGDNVALSYVAFHPNNFLDWDLTVSLGITGIVASIPPSPPPTNTSSGAPGSPATFNNTAGALLTPPSGPQCTQGALAAALYCAARATDGYERLSQYDCQAVIAFALTKPCPPF
jgi:hypothetical protein